jgi:hypothetical protein
VPEVRGRVLQGQGGRRSGSCEGESGFEGREVRDFHPRLASSISKVGCRELVSKRGEWSSVCRKTRERMKHTSHTDPGRSFPPCQPPSINFTYHHIRL